MGEQFCLKWNNHQSTLISLFDTLLESEKYVDCTLSAEGKVLKAHKVVLSACSPYLEYLLNQHLDKHPILIFNDMKFLELKAMLEYMYRGEVNVLQEQLNGFLKAAETLKIKGLTDQGGGGDTGGGGGNKRKPPDTGRVGTPESGGGGGAPPKRRRPRRSSQGSESSHMESGNSCDTNPPKPETELPPTILHQQQPPSLPATPRIPNNPAPKQEPQEIIQPKTEYIDDMNNDEQVEDLTLDDDEDEDSYLAKPGTSHATDNSQDYNSAWHLSDSRTGDESSFMAVQEAMGNQSNSQDGFVHWLAYDSLKYARSSERNQFSCSVCGKRYRWKSTLKRHETFECGGKEPAHGCPHCPYRAKQSGNLRVHLRKYHSDQPMSPVNSPVQPDLPKLASH